MIGAFLVTFALLGSFGQVPDPCATLVFGGDVMLAANLPPFAPYNPTPLPYGFLFERIAPFIREGDLAFCNLENPISGRGKRLNKQFAFNAPPNAGAALADAGFDAVSLANNHCLDFGEVALSDTLEHLSLAHVQYSGIEPETPVIIEAKGLRVALLSYLAPSVYPIPYKGLSLQPAKADKNHIIADVFNVREESDIVVVSLHWGCEFSPQRDPAQVTLAHDLIDAGVHIVVGHHPHVQQEVEYYHNGIIFYSLGNLVFAKYSKPVSRKTRLYRVEVDKSGVVSAAYLPVQIQEGGQPKPLAIDYVTLPR